MKLINLTKGKQALVDDIDFEHLSRYKWQYISRKDGRSGYAMRSVWNGELQKNTSGILMHRLIAQAKKNEEVDHIDGNPLNNQKSNLRICTTQQNKRNTCKRNRNCTSKYKGVTWSKNNKKWSAYFAIDKKRYSLGLFKEEKDAALAYNSAVKIYFGEFAKLNSIEGYDTSPI